MTEAAILSRPSAISRAGGRTLDETWLAAEDVAMLEAVARR